MGSASGLGLGYSPKAPGTAGSLLGIPLGIWISQSFSPELQILFYVLIFVFSCWVAIRAGDHWGERDSGKIVIDEVLGQALSLSIFFGAYPEKLLSHSENFWPWILALFLTFRLFDIVKPPPARWLDRQNSGWGVVGDDVVAGIYSGLICVLAARVIS